MRERMMSVIKYVENVCSTCRHQEGICLSLKDSFVENFERCYGPRKYYSINVELYQKRGNSIENKRSSVCPFLNKMR